MNKPQEAPRAPGQVVVEWELMSDEEWEMHQAAYKRNLQDEVNRTIDENAAMHDVLDDDEEY